MWPTAMLLSYVISAMAGTVNNRVTISMDCGHWRNGNCMWQRVILRMYIHTNTHKHTYTLPLIRLEDLSNVLRLYVPK